LASEQLIHGVYLDGASENSLVFKESDHLPWILTMVREFAQGLGPVHRRDPGPVQECRFDLIGSWLTLKEREQG
jgi:hypothetical protein